MNSEDYSIRRSNISGEILGTSPVSRDNRASRKPAQDAVARKERRPRKAKRAPGAAPDQAQGLVKGDPPSSLGDDDDGHTVDCLA